MDFQEILQLAKEFLVCPACGSHFSNENVRFQGLIDNKIVIQTECTNGHKPINALFISSFTPQNRETSTQETSLSADEILDLKISMDNFDGDFQRIFEQIDEEKNNGITPKS